jgi:SpoVK/Ycf46/Vps4 family AAA+-type ATPase
MTLAPADEAAARLAALSLAAPPPTADTTFENNAAAAAAAAVAGVDAAARALRELVLWPAQYAREGAALGVRWPRGLLLHGPPGCGKTSLVRAAAAEAGAALHVVTAGAVFGAYLGESERRLRGAFAAAARDAAAGRPALVFLDEVDALCPRRAAGAGGGGGGQHEARVVAQLLTLLDGAAGLEEEEEGEEEEGGGGAGTGAAPPRARVAVVAATNRPNAVDPALRRPGRLDREVLVPVPDAAARSAILRLHARGLRPARGVDLGAIARGCHGYSGADLAALAREAAMCALADAAAAAEAGGADVGGAAPAAAADAAASSLAAGGGGGGGVTADHFARAARRVGPSVVRGAAVDPGPVRWSDVGGLEAAKRALRRAVEWPLTRGDEFARLGVEPPRGVLLHGPPGCSKTTLARAAAAESGATFVPLSCASLFSPYVGEGEAALRDAFARARAAAPAVLLLDEADALAPGRGGGGGGGAGGGASGEEDGGASLRLLSTLLTEMDGLGVASSAYAAAGEGDDDDADAPRAPPAPGVVVVAATNRPGALDAALLRPGRLDVHVYVGPPADAAERLAALEVHARGLPLAADADLRLVAERTGRFTGAELAALCREAAMGALRERFSAARRRAGAAAASREGKEEEEEEEEEADDGGAAIARGVEVGQRHFEAARRAMAPALDEEEIRRYEAWGRRRGEGAGDDGG